VGASAFARFAAPAGADRRVDEGPAADSGRGRIARPRTRLMTSAERNIAKTTAVS
jgi:hypothetical protein